MGCGASIPASSKTVNQTRPTTNQSCHTIDLSIWSEQERSDDDEGEESLLTGSKPAQKGDREPEDSRNSIGSNSQPDIDPVIRKAMQGMLSGDLSVEFVEDIKIVRIFTSSTFTDTSVERNTLMSQVYPRLKEFCREHGYDFQVVDLRWGIREEAEDDHMLTELCIKEIKACQKLSTGPNFITFLGQKYGYRPLPRQINSREFENLLTAIKNQHDRDLVNYWYLKDDNSVPSEYILQPISSRLPDFRNKEHAQLRREAADQWWAAYERIQMILRHAADEVLDTAQARKYHMSITEEEVRTGVLDSPNPEKQCFWFKRVINDLRENSSKTKAPLFIDKDRMGESIDEVAQSLLEVLKKEEISATLPDDNITTYNVHWSDQGIDPESSQEHENYIEGLCNHFYDTLKNSFKQAMEEKENNASDDSLMKELLDQGSFCQRKCKTFHGRSDFLRSIKERLQQQISNRVIVIHGESGCGKTSTMAKVAMDMKTWMETSKSRPCVVIYRFLGTSPESSSTRHLLRSLCTQICRACHASVAKIPEDLKSLMEFFPKCLANAAQCHSIVLVLDSLDQLTGDALGQELEWWPKELPDNVSAVVSTLPDEKYKCLPYLKALLPATCFMEVPKLSSTEAETILDGWLSDIKRCLQPQQKQIVLEAFRTCQLPLYLKLAFDQAKGWKSYTPVDETKLKLDVRGIIHDLFDRLERLHGGILVKRIFGYITASKAGLSQPELDDLLSLDDIVLNDIYQFWTPPIRRMIPLLWYRLHSDVQDYLIERGADGLPVVYWYHRQFIETAKERYLNEGTSIEIHNSMAEFFSGKWADGKKKPYKTKEGTIVAKDRLVARQPLTFDENPDKPVFNRRKLSELPAHLLHSRQLGELKELTLCNFDFLFAKLRATSLDDVIDDVSMATDMFPEDKELLMVEQFLHLSSMALINDPKQFPSQVLGRLSHCMDTPQTFPHLYKLVTKARSTSLTGFPTFISSHKCLTSPGGVLVSSTTVNDQNTYCAFSCNGKHVFIGCTSFLGLDVQIMAIASGKKISRANFRIPDEEKPSRWVLRASEIEENIILAGGAYHLFMLDTKTKHILHRFQALSKPIFNYVYPFAMFDEDTKLACLGDEGVKIFDATAEEAVHFYPVGYLSVESMKTLDARGRFLAYCADEDGFHLLNFQTLDQSTSVVKCRDKVKELKITRRDEIIVMTAKRKKLYIYDLLNQALLRVLADFEAYFGLNRLHVTKRGDYTVTFTEKQILICNLQGGVTKKIEKSDIFEENIDCTCLYSDDANNLFAVCYDKMLRLYNLDRMHAPGEDEAETEISRGVVSGVYPSNHASYIATKAIVNGQKELQMWNVGDGTPNMVRCLKYESGLNELRMCSPTRGVVKLFNQSSETFAFGVIDMLEGKVGRVLTGDAENLWAIGFYDNVHFMAFSREKACLMVWNIDKGILAYKYRVGKRPISSALMSMDGQVVVCSFLEEESASEKTLPLLAFRCRQAKYQVLKIKKAHLTLQGASLSVDGDLLVALTKDGRPSVWDLTSGELNLQLPGEGVSATNISSRQNIAITSKGERDCILQMWDIKTGAHLAIFETQPTHKLLLSPSGNILYSFYGTTYHAWDLERKRKLASITLDWEAVPKYVYIAGDALVFPIPQAPVLMALQVLGAKTDAAEMGAKMGDPYENVPFDGKLVLPWI